MERVKYGLREPTLLIAPVGVLIRDRGNGFRARRKAGRGNTDTHDLFTPAKMMKRKFATKANLFRRHFPEGVFLSVTVADLCLENGRK